jgi:hypothetical protein
LNNLIIIYAKYILNIIEIMFNYILYYKTFNYILNILNGTINYISLGTPISGVTESSSWDPAYYQVSTHSLAGSELDFLPAHSCQVFYCLSLYYLL